MDSIIGILLTVLAASFRIRILSQVLIYDVYFLDECTCKLQCAWIQKPDHASSVHRLACDIAGFLAL